jgi:SAM-dependent methyltransferase
MNKLSKELEKELKEYGQFPYGKRNRAYQTIGDHHGVRDMEYRYEIMNLPKSFEGKTVVDVGCSVGAICIEAKKRGAKRVVGIDYKKETVDVAKKVASEYNLDIEYYTFNVDDGLDSLKLIIGDEEFDYVFALSIWGHVKEQNLADIINYYTKEICWFEGHGWDTKHKIEQYLGSILNYSKIIHLGETNDRSVRQNFKLFYKETKDDVESVKIKLGGRNESIYFGGEEYEFVALWDTKRNETEEECNSERYDISTKDRYYFTGRFCRFLGSEDKDYGYKIFTDKLERKQVNILFDIQNLLFESGFAPRPYEIIKCHDDTREYFAIKMDNIRGTHVQPDRKWIDKLIEFCEINKIYREVRSIKDDCIPKNCIKDNGKIYLVDIDQRYRMNTEKKNVVLIPWIEREEAVNSSGIGRADRTKGYKYGVDSWKQWCEKHDVEFFLMDTLLVPESEMVITWQRWYVLEILEENGINYDQVLLCDADSVIHPDCPNFFEETTHEFSSAFCNGDYEWVNRAIKGYSQMFFGCDYYIKSSEFFQTCFVILNEEHRDFLKKVVDWYWENKDQVISSYDIVKCGSDQPLINLLAKKFGVDVNFLPYKYSIMDLHRKNLIYTDPTWNWWEDDLSNLYNSGWVYQFNAIPQNRMNRGQSYWMERIYNELYNV